MNQATEKKVIEFSYETIGLQLISNVRSEQLLPATALAALTVRTLNQQIVLDHLE